MAKPGGCSSHFPPDRGKSSPDHDWNLEASVVSIPRVEEPMTGNAASSTDFSMNVFPIFDAGSARRAALPGRTTRGPGSASLGRSCWLAVAALAGMFVPAPAAGPILFRDVTAETGVAFQHTDGSSGRHYIVETVASGLATFDYDGDGLIDVYFLNGRPLPGTTVGRQPINALYRNLGGFRFRDVTAEAGIGDPGYALGVAVADYNNDGYPDLYLNNFGPNRLYHNAGDGTFRDVTGVAGVGRGNTPGAGANFLDFDGDGALDLFVANYICFTYENHVVSMMRGAARYAGPRDFPAQPNHLFRNLGEDAFADVSQSSGIAAHAGAGMGTICLDYDGDGRTDIFVANDQSWNFLFRNLGQGRFAEVGLAAGVACNFGGETVSSMGADAGDYDNNGWLDLLVTDYEREKPLLFRNSGPSLGRGAVSFSDVAAKAGVGVGATAYVKWGCGFVDFDNDGHRDIFIGCGHLQDDIEQYTDRSSYAVRPVLFRNLGNGRFANVSDSAGDGMQVRLVARGVAFDDLDNDGRVDVVILNARRQATILRNESANDNHWLQIELRGRTANRDGVGAFVRVVAGDLTLVDEVHSGRGYQSHFGSRLHFGLGPRKHADFVEVRWIGGGTDRLEHVAANQRLVIREGVAVKAATGSEKGD